MECDLKPWEVEELLDFLDAGLQQKGEISLGLAKLFELLQEGFNIKINRV